MNPRIRTVAIALLVSGWAGEARPQECTPVGSLPFRVEAPGSYCLQTNLIWPAELTARAGVAAVEIAADDVVLDLRGFRVSGPGHGRLNGIRAVNRRNVTIRNGAVSGFFVGVSLKDGLRGPEHRRGHVVEGLRVSRYGGVGVEVQGGGSRIEGNVVDVVDGAAARGRFGIVAEGARQVVLENDIFNVAGRPGAEDAGIVVRSGPGTIVRGNRVTGRGSGRGCGLLVSNSKGAETAANDLAGLRTKECATRAEGAADEP